MIHSVDITDPSNTHIEHLAKVPALAQPRRFDFKPGLNVLWGRNGSGKSTLLRTLAVLFHCEQSGQPVVTGVSMRALFGRWPWKDRGWKRLEESVRVDHDGQPVRHFDPSNAPGLVGGLAGFDWDFGKEGIQNAMFRGSAGETTSFRFERLLNEIVAGKVPTLGRKASGRHLPPGDDGLLKFEIADRILAGNAAERGPLTVLLDEPERSFDLPMQVSVWRFLRAYASRYQFIVASHSLYALNIPEAHYVELTPGYLDVSLRCAAMLAGWKDEKPPVVDEARWRANAEQSSRKRG